MNLGKIRNITLVLLLLLIIELIPLSNKFIKNVMNIYSSKDWGIGYNKNSPPTGTDSVDTLKLYDSFFIDDDLENGEKVVYLTFDAGYENGYTETILDTLKSKNVPATFFLVSHYFKSAPELVKRMVNEGHIIGNHTMSHPKISNLSSKDELRKQIVGLEELYKELTGKDMKKYFRPPSGNYNINSLEQVKELGYKTIFWSLAYADWDNNKQPSHDYAIEKLMSRMHNGAIILLHSTSKTNSEILGEFIDILKADGYEFKSLDYLIAKNY